jgi:hypothetical protein
LTIDKKKKKRSLDANAYFWVLCNKLSAKLNIPDRDIYQNLIKDIGGNCYIQPIRNDAVPKWIEIWEGKGYGWICDNLGDSKLDGYTNIKSYYGSSFYDTKQMSRLIDLIIQECNEQGIETATPEKLALMLDEWGNANGR